MKYHYIYHISPRKDGKVEPPDRIRSLAESALEATAHATDPNEAARAVKDLAARLRGVGIPVTESSSIETRINPVPKNDLVSSKKKWFSKRYELIRAYAKQMDLTAFATDEDVADELIDLALNRADQLVYLEFASSSGFIPLDTFVRRYLMPDIAYLILPDVLKIKEKP